MKKILFPLFIISGTALGNRIIAPQDPVGRSAATARSAEYCEKKRVETRDKARITVIKPSVPRMAGLPLNQRGSQVYAHPMEGV
jgi:hypothetical protein